jgi:hypothetical protein
VVTRSAPLTKGNGGSVSNGICFGFAFAVLNT